MKSPRYTLLLAILNGFAIAASAESQWPQFRGPTGQGISSATNVPIHWSATSNVVWKTAIPGHGWSSPVLADGRLYVTTPLSATRDHPFLCARSV